MDVEARSPGVWVRIFTMAVFAATGYMVGFVVVRYPTNGDPTGQQSGAVLSSFVGLVMGLVAIAWFKRQNALDGKETKS
jgi:Ni,Fe-hydrogenase I cytochrome b subunit